MREAWRLGKRRFVRMAIALAAIVAVASALAIALPRAGAGHTAALISTPSPRPTVTPNPTYAAQAGDDAVGFDFAPYYSTHAGATLLGQALTPEMPVAGGLTQMYAGGVLFRSLTAGIAIAPQPVVSQLIDTGATEPIVPGGALTYADLFALTGSAALTPAPWWWSASAEPATAGIFVPEGARQGVTIGHYIPADFAAFVARIPAWQSVLGEPITEPLMESVTVSGVTRNVVAQAFERAVMSGTVSPGERLAGVSLRSVGRDWLAIFGRPALSVASGTPARVVAPGTTLLAAAGGGGAIATFDTPFAVTLLAAAWQGSALWYHVAWQNLLEQRDGWLPGTSVAFSAASGHTPEIAAVDALSPQLVAYVNGLGDNVALAVYVPDEHRYYEYNANLALETASVIKVPMLVTLLGQAEAQHRALTTAEQSEAAQMIDYSDNYAAQSIYDEVGEDAGIEEYMDAIGVKGVWVNPDGWGSSTMSPLTSIALLEDLRAGSILTPADCQYVLSLMASVVSFERMGLGDTAPPGATVALKDGYGPEENKLDVMVTIGIVTYQGHAYDVAVYTRDEQTIDQGTAYVNAICADIAQALTGQT